MIKADCIHFKGEKPCQFKILCDHCPYYQPFPTRILIIKCAAQGDVLRTTPLLSGLKRKYPQWFKTKVSPKSHKLARGRGKQASFSP